MKGSEQAPSMPAMFTVPREDNGVRLDLVASKAFDLPRSKAKKAILNGQCLLDDAIVTNPSLRIKEGQILSLDLPEESNSLLPEEGDLTVLYRDEHLAILDKAAGLTVHPCPSCPEGTLVHRLLAFFPELAKQEGFRPGIVHRLDKDTSGLMVVALTEQSRLALAEAFASRTVHKTYLALCRGVPPTPGGSNLPLGRHPSLKTKMAVVPENKGGKNALTDWQALYSDPAQNFALMAVRIHTGRTHQIRVHLAHAGHPLWGDKTYGPAYGSAGEKDPAPRQMLHAWKLEFIHPATGKEMKFFCPPPQDFSQTAAALADKTLHPMQIILTGNPGSGKSSVLKRLASRNIPTWSADECVARLYQPGGDAWLMLKGRFGERFISEPPARPNAAGSVGSVGTSGTAGPSVNRTALTAAMAQDAALRKEIEGMIHPMVYADMLRFFAEAGKDAVELAVAEVPLWFETEKAYTGTFPAKPVTVVTVTCPQATRHARLEKSRGWTPEKCAAVESWQWPESAKAQASTLCISNGQNLEELDSHVDLLVEELRNIVTLRKQKIVGGMEKCWQNPED